MKKMMCAVLAALVLLAGCGSAPSSLSVPEAPATESVMVLPPQSELPSLPASMPPAETPSLAARAESDGPSQSNPSTFRLTIPEGYTLARIGLLLEEKGICTMDEYMAVVQTGDFSGYAMLAQQNQSVNRCFQLEGYLFPDTYEFYTGVGPEEIVRRMLDNAQTRLGGELANQIAASGYSLDQILTMASIIEKEALGQESMTNISSVLHNRLNSGMQLQCDVTIKYVEGAIKPFITGDVNRFNSDYNTYKCPALPAGPICNPGMMAIQAAVAPADTGYYYFLTDENGQYYWATTFEEHTENRRITGV